MTKNTQQMIRETVARLYALDLTDPTNLILVNILVGTLHGLTRENKPETESHEGDSND